MGNTGEGGQSQDPNDKRSRFMCGSNKQERKHNKNKVRKSKSPTHTPSLHHFLLTRGKVLKSFDFAIHVLFDSYWSLVLFEFEKRWLSPWLWKSMARWSKRASSVRKPCKIKWTTISEATTWTDWVSKTGEAIAATWPDGIRRRVNRVTTRPIGTPTCQRIHINLTHGYPRTLWSPKMYLLLGRPAEPPYSSIKTSKRRTARLKTRRRAASPPTSRGTSAARPFKTRSIKIRRDSPCRWTWEKLSQTLNSTSSRRTLWPMSHRLVQTPR